MGQCLGGKATKGGVWIFRDYDFGWGQRQASHLHVRKCRCSESAVCWWCWKCVRSISRWYSLLSFTGLANPRKMTFAASKFSTISANITNPRLSSSCFAMSLRVLSDVYTSGFGADVTERAPMASIELLLCAASIAPYQGLQDLSGRFD